MHASSPLPDLVPARGRRLAVTARILSAVVFSFVAYLSIGMPMAVLPGFVHVDLGFGAVWAGLAISVQYLATLISRPHAGRMTDTAGPKRTVCLGMIAVAVSGAMTMLAGVTAHWPVLSFAVLVVGRLALGCGESWASTGSITWGIGGIGGEHTARVISWNGIATYGGIAVGAPLGVVIVQHFGIAVLGLATLLSASLMLPAALLKKAVVPSAGERLPFRQVFGRVFPYGMGLALATIGFGALSTFVALYYSSRGWQGAAATLSLFGGSFIATRLVFGNAIDRFGGHRVAMVSMTLEAAGLVLLWQATTPHAAFVGAALTGIGFALIFPALGVEAVSRVSTYNRGAALGAYSVCLDIAMGAIGPVGGLLADHLGYPPIFLLGALCALSGLVLTTCLYRRHGLITRPTG
jgi:MFS family permease